MIVYYTVDDICAKHLEGLKRLEALRTTVPEFRMTAFVIAGDLNAAVTEWLKQNRDWVEVGVHGWRHDDPPEMERPYEERTGRLRRAFEALRPLLPQRYGYRAPGFQMTATSYALVKEMGFYYIAHQTRIQPFRGYSVEPGRLINTHIYDTLNLKGLEHEHFKTLGQGLYRGSGV